ncbi:fungal-specific transcription factor domain-containing protein [Lasiosphaeria miniovina]|uniref:Fungal-specific transcription factor domain-containing protein n=1 Tax=Lasiosphaeria miniovina TaxID=1954250 RepID=A0AA40AKJ8_9PEZI|nr:fungal-specific transcription factor domain-containing protein [Lasiosphaeria miniovina]KAK0717549.1 fungal-specific transcription factor domain-containing protein [Lasiosphaeria miniovina]
MMESTSSTETASHVRSHVYKPRHSAVAGLQLSWPHAGDRKRARVGEEPTASRGKRKAGLAAPTMTTATRIVNVLHRDMEAHYGPATSAAQGTGRASSLLDRPCPPKPVDSLIDDGYKDLLEHFQLHAAASLAVAGHTQKELGDALLRIAMTNPHTVSARALLQAILAFSSLQRHGLNIQDAELKVAAIKSLVAASGSSNIGTTEAVQHVAASMLLCSFETHHKSCTWEEWTLYLHGAKDVIQAAGLNRHPDAHRGGDVAILLAWVYYHDVLARFSAQVWRGQELSTAVTLSASPFSVGSFTAVNPASGRPLTGSCMLIRAEMPHAAQHLPAFALLQLLSEVVDAVATPQPPPDGTEQRAETTDDHGTYLAILDWRIRNVQLAHPEAHYTTTTQRQQQINLELFQLAMLIYLARMPEHPRPHSKNNNHTNPNTKQRLRTQEDIDRAFTLLAQSSACAQQFPIFMLGSEARRDEQRAAVLDVIARTEHSGTASRDFLVCKMLEAVWAQDDLAEASGWGMGFRERVGRVMGRVDVMPPFV